MQVVLQGAGYARSHIPLRFRPSDDLDVALKRLGLNPYHHKRELSVLLGSNI
ncbi:MAG: hypothetical protein GWO40_08360, partial [Gammaproteobacteria bacterium]|nr:hypothetical protein [Gammaproteobacteria bacterium]NIV51577.1 hypothetical protein [Gammaproteobacteria bacterium]NIX05753.1 hypothetical protein [Gammaproteobacteria bacterium]NIX85562.1 hypothetical protein [Gammaproteobacteria bacterium]